MLKPTQRYICNKRKKKTIKTKFNKEKRQDVQSGVISGFDGFMCYFFCIESPLLTLFVENDVLKYLWFYSNNVQNAQ